MFNADALEARVRCAGAARDRELALRARPAVGARAVKRRRSVDRHRHASAAVKARRREAGVFLTVCTRDSCILRTNIN